MRTDQERATVSRAWNPGISLDSLAVSYFARSISKPLYRGSLTSFEHDKSTVNKLIVPQAVTLVYKQATMKIECEEDRMLGCEIPRLLICLEMMI